MKLIRQETASLIRDRFGLSEAVTEAFFDAGLFRADIARKVLIRLEYYQRCSKGSKTDLKWELAEKYCLSVSSVEKILKE